MDEIIQDFGIAGVNLLSDGELLGVSPDTRKKLRAAAATQSAAQDKGARAEFAARLHLLPADIKKGLKDKRLQIVDYNIYSIKTLAAGNKTLKVYEGQDVKGIGIRNIANAKLEKDFWFLLSAIQFQLDPSGAPSQYDATILRYFYDGEFQFKVGDKTVVPKSMSLNVFGQNNLTTMPNNYFKLTSPKLLEPQLEFDMPVDFATAPTVDTDVRVTLWGAAVVPY